ncbi:S-formylglutathione hydrolase [Shewanella corallii]|uniref:S-formylglutathione hydrolase YeiG n=1 Tax=Shewanella corallii TaxID=560080 RepID=A0ABT0N7D5_9GAMM|nr:alpha/beta hydrolase-fold protein [Shewanella corallii]MCL2914295.1 S-formylglutathione hydrolase [Shewanella corallii]
MITAKLSAEKCFGGWVKRFSHRSSVLNCDMSFSLYLPPQADLESVPAVYWLGDSGQTDTSLFDAYVAQSHAASLGLALICPDVLPRGEYVPDLASRLGCDTVPSLYLNATCMPWQRHFRMFDYLQSELPALIESHFPVSDRKAISGLGLGAHGAMVLALSQPQKYASISGFNPEFAPQADTHVAAMLELLMGESQDARRQYDIAELLTLGISQLPVLLHQAEIALTPALAAGQKQVLEAAKARGYPLELVGLREYTASTGFVASFIGQQLKFHSLYL